MPGSTYVADARHGERGLGHVGREHDAALRARVEHAVLVARREPRVERKDLGLAVRAAAPAVRCAVADLALAREEHQHVAERRFARDLVQRGEQRVATAAVAAVPHFSFSPAGRRPG
jgi:hypothetical protein